MASRGGKLAEYAYAATKDKNNGETVFRRGRYTIDYSEKIGLGSKQYELVEMK